MPESAIRFTSTVSRGSSLFLREGAVSHEGLTRLRVVWVGMIAFVVAVVLTARSNPHIPHLLRYGAAVFLLWGAPAVGWALVASGRRLERVAIGGGMAFVCTGLATLALHLIPGAFPSIVAILSYGLLACMPLLLLPRCANHVERPSWPKQWLAVLFVVVIAAAVRFPSLAYSEFQGDEAVILRRAAQALAGDDQELYLHQKGPVEILVPMSLWALTGTVNEWQARVPFALAGLLAVVVVMALTERLFGDDAAPIGGLLVAINGFLVAFSRIVQYQNLVVVLGGLALLALLRYRDSHNRAYLMLSALFMGFGLLTHYDAVLWGPAVLVVIGEVLVRSKAEGKPSVQSILVGTIAAGLVGIVVLGLFYVPFVRDPMFARTYAYLAGGRLGGSIYHNSLMSVWRMSTFYNALVYVVGLASLVFLAVVLRVGKLAAWVSFLVPFVFYCFIVADPRTHIYTFYPAAAMLAGGAFSGTVRTLPRKWRIPFTAGTTLWCLFSAGYLVVAFLNHQVEYKRDWPESRHPLYPVPFMDEELPPYGHFGFPYRAGWKAVESLYAEGVMSGTYASNEEPEITTWYVRSGERTMCGNPDAYIVAEDVQDEIVVDWEEIERDYVLTGEVVVAGRPKIRIFGRIDGPMLTVDASAVARAFDSAATVDAQLPFGYGLDRVGHFPVERSFGNVARLLGYDLSASRLRPGESIWITLYWKALGSPDRNYQVFTHLVGAEELVAQDDGAPACAHAPTSLWEAGQLIRDEHRIELDEDVLPERLDLRVGMYDLLTLERLTVDGGPADYVVLETLEVMP